MNQIRTALSSAALYGVVSTGSVHAAPVTMHFSGTVTSQSHFATGTVIFPTAHTFSGWMTFDIAKAAVVETYSQASYAFTQTGCAAMTNGSCTIPLPSGTPVVTGWQFSSTLTPAFSLLKLPDGAHFSQVDRARGNGTGMSYVQESYLQTNTTLENATTQMFRNSRFLGILLYDEGNHYDVFDLGGAVDLSKISGGNVNFSEMNYSCNYTGSLCPELAWSPDSFSMTGQLTSLRFEATPVSEIPEPSTALLLAIGPIALLLSRNRKRTGA